MRRQSIKRGIWHIGGRGRLQTGGFFPLAALAGPVIGGLAYHDNDDNHYDNDVDKDDIPRDNIILRKRPVPNRVTLPNGRAFYARYERVPRSNLPANVSCMQKSNRSMKTKKTKRT